jgi:hypothetical protein
MRRLEEAQSGDDNLPASAAFDCSGVAGKIQSGFLFSIPVAGCAGAAEDRGDVVIPRCWLFDRFAFVPRIRDCGGYQQCERESGAGCSSEAVMAWQISD